MGKCANRVDKQSNNVYRLVMKKRTTKASREVDRRLAEGADLRKLHPAGHYPNVADKAALRLARAIHYAESTHCATSWSAQERAQEFFNANGLAATLDECERLEALRLKEGDDK
jgi:hypothetical protein